MGFEVAAGPACGAPRSSLRAFAADFAMREAFCAAAPASWGRAVWSVAETNSLLLPHIERPGEAGGHGVHIERTLFDAFLPVNAMLSATLAFVSAAVMEVTRTNKINDLVVYIGGEDDSNEEEPSLRWEWDRVGHDTVANFTKDAGSQTLARCIERVAKPKLVDASYCQLLKHAHKAACRDYREAKQLASATKMSASRSAAKALALSPTFYAVRSSTCWVADVFVDLVACAASLGARLIRGNSTASPSGWPAPARRPGTLRRAQPPARPPTRQILPRPAQPPPPRLEHRPQAGQVHAERRPLLRHGAGRPLRLSAPVRLHRGGAARRQHRCRHACEPSRHHRTLVKGS